MTPKKRPPMRKAAKIGTLLEEVFGNSEIAEQMSRHQAWLVWDKIVGEQIAKRARPLRLRDNVLEVRVDHPVWMQQLQMLKPKILEKLNRQVPNAGITDIYLRRGRTAPAVSTPPPVAAPPDWQREKLSADEQESIENSLLEISDPELKTELARIFSLQKRLEKGRRKN